MVHGTLYVIVSIGVVAWFSRPFWVLAAAAPRRRVLRRLAFDCLSRQLSPFSSRIWPRSVSRSRRAPVGIWVRRHRSLPRTAGPKRRCTSRVHDTCKRSRRRARRRSAGAAHGRVLRSLINLAGAPAQPRVLAGPSSQASNHKKCRAARCECHKKNDRREKIPFARESRPICRGPMQTAPASSR